MKGQAISSVTYLQTQALRLEGSSTLFDSMFVLHAISICLCIMVACKPSLFRSILRAAVWPQERLTSGYYSLAQRLQDALHMNVSVAPAGLAWEQVHRMSAGSAAANLPAGQISC